MQTTFAKFRRHAFIALAALAAFGVGYSLRGPVESGPAASLSSPPAAAGHDHEAHGTEGEGSETLFVCPMNCIPPMQKAGNCPVCGMELTPAAAQDQGRADQPPRIVLTEKAVAAAGIRTAPAEHKFVSADIRLFGKIEYDPIEQFKVTAFAPGVIDNIFVTRAGQAVRRGDPLFDLHSSELYYLEQELFEVLAKLPYKLDMRPGKGHGSSRLGRWTRLQMPTKPDQEGMTEDQKKIFNQEFDKIKRKMRLLGLSDEDIDEAIVRGRPTGISTVTTPMTGIVLKQNAFRGVYVNTGDVVFTIANPRVLWARLDAYASDFPWLRLGQEAEFETDAYPGQSFKGKVVFIDPEFDAESRVFKVGVLYRDEKGLLKPNMLVRAVVYARLTSGGKSTTELVTDGMMDTAQTKRTGQPPLVIPETAPLITGTRSIVYVALPGKPGIFEGREVKLGPRAQGYYIVRDGLAKGEEVVVNGNFKIDSAVQILARTSMMSGKTAGMPVLDHQLVETPPPPPAETKADQRQRGAQYEVHQGHNRGRPAGSAPAAPETMPAPAVPGSHSHGAHEPPVRQ
ncbi:MAG: efflux RND transporter periplasmic adaptor subunit [Desulfobacterales bacterium]|jgi:Cu(I)/Ag(I) efflux system membrane fusion protein|nr:efflux RND transporter periplasmic adaptor subunit [Desulfobacterales bacterium]